MFAFLSMGTYLFRMSEYGHFVVVVVVRAMGPFELNVIRNGSRFIESVF